MNYIGEDTFKDVLAHYGVKGMKKGVRRWTNEDGSLTEAGYRHYGIDPNYDRAQGQTQLTKQNAVVRRSSMAPIRSKYFDKQGNINRAGVKRYNINPYDTDADIKRKIAERDYYDESRSRQKSEAKEEAKQLKEQRTATRKNIKKYVVGGLVAAGLTAAGYSYFKNKNLDKKHLRDMEVLVEKGRQAKVLKDLDFKMKKLDADTTRFGKQTDLNIAKTKKEEALAVKNMDYETKKLETDKNARKLAKIKANTVTSVNTNIGTGKTDSKKGNEKPEKEKPDNKPETTKSDNKPKREKPDNKPEVPEKTSAIDQRAARLDRKKEREKSAARTIKALNERRDKKNREYDAKMTKELERMRAESFDTISKENKEQIQKKREERQKRLNETLKGSWRNLTSNASIGLNFLKKSTQFLHEDTGSDYLAHYGIKGQSWGVRRFQNEDGTLTDEGKARYGLKYSSFTDKELQDAVNYAKNKNAYRDLITEGSKTRATSISDFVKSGTGLAKNVTSLNKDTLGLIGDKTIEEHRKAISGLKYPTGATPEQKQAIDSEKEAHQTVIDNVETSNKVLKALSDSAGTLNNITNQNVVSDKIGEMFTGMSRKEQNQLAEEAINSVSPGDLAKLVNRLRLEKEYENLINPPKKSKLETGREWMQSAAALVGLASLGVKLYKNIKGLKVDEEDK